MNIQLGTTCTGIVCGHIHVCYKCLWVTDVCDQVVCENIHQSTCFFNFFFHLSFVNKITTSVKIPWRIFYRVQVEFISFITEYIIITLIRRGEGKGIDQGRPAQ